MIAFALLVVAAAVLLSLAFCVNARRTNRELAAEARAATDQLRLAMESGQAVAWDWDLKTGRVVMFGDLKKVFGIDADRRVGRLEDFGHRLHDDDREVVWQAVSDARRRRVACRATFRLVWPDGTVRWVAATGKFCYAADGEATRMLGIGIDTSERKFAEQALRESEARFRAIADTTPVMLWMADTDNQCTYVNRSWIEFTGRPLEDQLGDGWLQSIHPGHAMQCLEASTRGFERREPYTIEYQVRRHDGEYRWVFDSGVPRYAPDGTFEGYMGSAVDVTAHKLAQESLATLGQKLIQAHEAEGARIARELHDDIGQRMAVITIELDGLNRSLPLPLAETRVRLRAIADVALGLAKDIQTISHSLHSAKLTYLGIVAASAAFCKEVSAQHGMVIDFSDAGIPSDVPNDVALCMFRVLQEALSNAVKHAAVTRVTVALRGNAEEIGLEVRDSGIGFEPEAARRSGGLGLISMQERLSLVGGEMVIESGRGRGTTIRARAPLRRADDRPVGAIA